MADEKRSYRKRARAEHEEETRRRITESAVELHGTLGPSRTSISAVAERAGVRRSTVYRHFPDEAALFAACSSHWAAQNIPPDPGAWAATGDPEQRARIALGELYAYYRQTAQMLANLLRDEASSAIVRELFQPFHQYLAAARETLVAGTGLRGNARRRALAAAGHAVAFGTWQSLTREGLSDQEAAELMTTLIMAECGSQPRPTTHSARRSSSRGSQATTR
jgi:AcrR family transcriptional regulator